VNLDENYFKGVDEPLKVTHLLFVNLVMDSLGAIMLGNEPALEKYMSEKPRRRDESIVSRAMMAQILTMGLWLTVVSFVYLKTPFIAELFGGWAVDGAGNVLNGVPNAQHLTGYFVLLSLLTAAGLVLWTGMQGQMLHSAFLESAFVRQRHSLYLAACIRSLLEQELSTAALLTALEKLPGPKVFVQQVKAMKSTALQGGSWVQILASVPWIDPDLVRHAETVRKQAKD